MNVMQVGFVYDDVFLNHETPHGHPERKERLVFIVNALKASHLWEKLVHIKPRKATFEEIEMVHSHSYVERVRERGQGYLDPDTYLSRGSLEAALYAVGAVIEAVDRCRNGSLRRVFCAVRPPGHHAERDRAMGFCIFNNVAVAVRYAQKIGYRKIFITDFDVHHGNGTQHIFEDDDTVYYFSSHQYPHYPGTGTDSEIGRGKGKGFTKNIPMPYGSGDEKYRNAYNSVLPELMRQFSPDLVLVSAGYDICEEDPLSGIRVSDEGMRDIVRGTLSYPVPAVFSIEGGYNLEALSRSVVITIEEMMKD
jgi:acetoin utilization deacetylase AcuC-like enzyme